MIAYVRMWDCCCYWGSWKTAGLQTI